MIKIQSIKGFSGFGSGDKLGECFYSQGMRKGRFGIVPGWSATKVADQADLPTMVQTIRWFTQGSMGGTNYVAGLDSAGYLYRSQNGSSAWALFYKTGVSNYGNGLIFDQKNRLLYAGERHLGKYDGSLSNYTTGTIAVTNGSNAIVGTGTTFTADMVGKQIRIASQNTFYTVATFTDATHITLSSNYSSTTQSGLSYEIFSAATDQWKDFGKNVTDYRCPDVYEDWVLWANGNQVAALNVTDDSFVEDAFTFPENFTLRSVRSGRTGVLLGANFNNRGLVALWTPGNVRSIAPWVWFNSSVKAVIADQSTGCWFVFTLRGIYWTNGYTVETILEPVLDSGLTENSISALIAPQGAEVIGDYLAFLGQGTSLNRNLPGLYLLNLKTRLLDFAPLANVTQDAIGYAIFYDSNIRIHLSYSTADPAKYAIGRLTEGATRGYVVLEAGEGTTSKIAEAVKLNLSLSSRDTGFLANNYTVAVKIYNFRRILWNYAQTRAISTAEGVLKIDGTVFTAQVGDEVTVLEGVNAGYVRHIASIANQGTSNEEWTLDTALPNLTESTMALSVPPFQLVKKFTVTSSELTDLFFNIKNRIKGKKFLVKILFEISSGTAPELSECLFIYDDLGVLTS